MPAVGVAIASNQRMTCKCDLICGRGLKLPATSSQIEINVLPDSDRHSIVTVGGERYVLRRVIIGDLFRVIIDIMCYHFMS